MPEAQTEISNFDLSGGLNTELHDLAWPDGFTAAETNYELLPDGTRRRRKGLAIESSAGAVLALPLSLAGAEFVQSYIWHNVGGDPEKSFIVHQIGTDLYFTDNDDSMSGSWHGDAVGALGHTSQDILNVSNIRDNGMRFAQGRGHLFVTGPFLRPFYVEYDSVLDTFESIPIIVNYRDFEGIEDGLSIAVEPTGTITADHRYNLRNRGWKQSDMEYVFSNNSKHPAKNSLWPTLYRRGTLGAADAINRDPEGDRARNFTKFDAEVFGNSTAPMGSLFLNPFDTSFAHDITAAGPPVPISTWRIVTQGSTTWTIEITTTVNHGFIQGEVITILGQKMVYRRAEAGRGPKRQRRSFDGSYTITAFDGGTPTLLEIVIPAPINFDSFLDQFRQLGELGGSIALPNSKGARVEKGFKAIGFHAGRIWYAGLADGQFADHVFFSRLVETPEAYGQCHQRNDPTDETFNDITPADGGVLVIPGMQGITDMMVVGNSLILLGSEGAWEIAGGRGATFTATQFGVRKMTSANFNSPTGAIAVEDAGIATGPSGIYIFQPNEFTGVLEAKNMIEETIQTKWNSFTTSQQEYCQIAYDDAKRLMYFMLGADSTTSKYTEMLVFSTKKSAWYRYTFAPSSNFGLLSMIAISDADASSDNQKMKFLYRIDADTIQVADFNQTDFIDFDGNESPLPFMVTGFDNLGDFQRRKQAPIITVFQKRTETGFNAELDEAINESSTLMTAFWDWTEAIEWDSYTTPTTQQAWTGQTNNHGVSGKIGAQSQVYRHPRRFVPTSTGDVDGYPTVVTRNKVRGRGRVLQLRFDGAAAKDSHIVGWTTNYKVQKAK